MCRSYTCQIDKLYMSVLGGVLQGKGSDVEAYKAFLEDLKKVITHKLAKTEAYAESY